MSRNEGYGAHKPWDLVVAKSWLLMPPGLLSVTARFHVMDTAVSLVSLTMLSAALANIVVRYFA